MLSSSSPRGKKSIQIVISAKQLKDERKQTGIYSHFTTNWEHTQLGLEDDRVCGEETREEGTLFNLRFLSD